MEGEEDWRMRVMKVKPNSGDLGCRLVRATEQSASRHGVKCLGPQMDQVLFLFF